MIALLGYAGLFPFILLPLCSLVFPVMPIAQAMLLFQLYSCLILGFMAGAIWPVLYQAAQPTTRALGAVSFPVLAIVGITLIPAYSLPLLALLFFGLRLYEYGSDLNQVYPVPYRRLRNQLTAVVVSCHLGFYLGYLYVA